MMLIGFSSILRLFLEEEDDDYKMSYYGRNLTFLTETLKPDATRLELGKNTKEFVASLPKPNPNTPLSTIRELRDTVTDSIKVNAIPYPENITVGSFQVIEVSGMQTYILKQRNYSLVPTIVMFYGGGFCLNTLSAHQSFLAHVASLTECNIVLPNYALAPETKAPENIMQLEKFLAALLQAPDRYNISNHIIFMGWSSGGNQALTLAMNLRNKFPMLAAKISQIIALSPWIDLTMYVARSAPFQKQQALDTIAAGPDLLEKMAQAYLPKGYRGDEAEFCPATRSDTELKKLPPVTIVVGACEVLFSDAVFITDRLRRAGANVQFIAVEGQTHNYLVFHKLSLDGVFIPKLIANLINHESIERLKGEDGLGLVIKEFNTLLTSKL